MTTMAHAIAQAGLKVPTLPFRVWHWLKDHPNKSSKEIAAALKMSHNRASATAKYLADRDMATFVKAKRRDGRQDHFIYCAVGGEYELLPLPAGKVKVKAKWTATTADSRPTEKPAAMPRPVGEPIINKPVPEFVVAKLSVAEQIAAMNVLEAHSMYKQLKMIFGGANG